MSNQELTCPACGKKGPHPGNQFAGKSMKCKCGERFVDEPFESTDVASPTKPFGTDFVEFVMFSGVLLFKIAVSSGLMLAGLFFLAFSFLAITEASIPKMLQSITITGLILAGTHLYIAFRKPTPTD